MSVELYLKSWRRDEKAPRRRHLVYIITTGDTGHDSLEPAAAAGFGVKDLSKT